MEFQKMAYGGDLIAEPPMKCEAKMPEINYTLVRDERSAACAADAYACSTGKPGVAVGLGTTGLTDGFVESLSAFIPIIGEPSRSADSNHSTAISMEERI